MNDLPESALYEGVEVDLLFKDPLPGFGDLFLICGYENPNFPPSGNFNFHLLEYLQFSQVDDYFGVQSLSDEGDDVVVWLYPLVAGSVVDHHPGPFDGLRVAYNVLRNPLNRAERFIHVIEAFLEKLRVELRYRTREERGGLSDIKRDIEAIAEYWQGQSISVGSDDALCVDY
jgi:hypothetical protein